MALGRREFLAYAAGAMSTRLALASARATPPAPSPPCRVLPVPGECSLPESTLGYRAALADLRAPLLVVPAVMELPRDFVTRVLGQLQAGGTVVVESGAGFSGHAKFRQHRHALHGAFGIDVTAPLDLWAAARRAPYVDYTWPTPATVRDFSRVVPVAAHEGTIIGWADGMPVALRREIGAGTLIFLGSPLGPALWAGDREARRWLRNVLATVSAPPRADAR